MLKKIKVSKCFAKYLAGISLAVTAVALNSYCYGVLGEPELPKCIKRNNES